MRLATYRGELAKWDNFACVMQNFTINPTPPRIQMFQPRQPQVKKVYKPIPKYRCIETGIVYESSKAAAEAHGLAIATITKSARCGATAGLINLSTMHCIKACYKFRKSIQPSVQDWLGLGYVRCHFERVEDVQKI